MSHPIFIPINAFENHLSALYNKALLKIPMGDGAFCCRCGRDGKSAYSKHSSNARPLISQ